MTMYPHLLSNHFATHVGNDRLKPLIYQIAETLDALASVNESSSNPAVKHEAFTLSQQICDFSFIVMLVIWYDVLHQGSATYGPRAVCDPLCTFIRPANQH
jgi:hypothetical protein